MVYDREIHSRRLCLGSSFLSPCALPCFGVQVVNFGDKGKTISQLQQIVVYFFLFLSRSDQFVYMLKMTHMEMADTQFHK